MSCVPEYRNTVVTSEPTLPPGCIAPPTHLIYNKRKNFTILCAQVTL